MVKKMNKSVKIVILTFLTIILLIIGSIFFLKVQLIPKKYADNTEFVVEKGAYGKQVFADLEEEGIIRNADICYLYARFLSPVTINFKAGRHVLEAGMNLDEIIETLSDDSKFYRPTDTITITEGSFVEDIAKTIGSGIGIASSELLAYWDDLDNVKTYISEYSFLTEEILNPDIRHPLEGYLFPSTYEFYDDSSYDEITRKMLDKTLSIYNEYESDFENAPEIYRMETKSYSKASIHEIFTLASILEWESGNDEDMMDIASVFYNRFEYPDMLRSSVTACYALGLDKDSCLMVDRDLNLAYTDDGEKYNTYTKFGLPIGPIGSAGEKAIYAALHPNDTDYFYFVGDICGIDGKTHFATVEEGIDNIARKYVSCK